MSEILINLVNPTIFRKHYSHRAGNLKVLMYQSPLNLTQNHQLICLMISYILSGGGYIFVDMMQAQLDGRTYNLKKFMTYCKEVGWDNPDFIDKLLLLDYGSIVASINYDKVPLEKFTSYVFMFTGKLDLNQAIHEFLEDVKVTLVKKKN